MIEMCPVESLQPPTVAFRIDYGRTGAPEESSIVVHDFNDIKHAVSPNNVEHPPDSGNADVVDNEQPSGVNSGVQVVVL